ncbi:MAG: hypothetical protein ACTHLJ_11285 [Angustibacter sp.]
MSGRRLVVVAGVVAVVALVLVGRLVAVHRETWDWRLTPAATPAKLHHDGRDSKRSAPPLSRPEGLHEVGRTEGGGVVLSTATGPGTPTVLYVQVGSELTGYALMGGP